MARPQCDTLVVVVVVVVVGKSEEWTSRTQGRERVQV
jgi:hypothetical protein